jgi:hypothetical protein
MESLDEPDIVTIDLEGKTYEIRKDYLPGGFFGGNNQEQTIKVYDLTPFQLETILEILTCHQGVPKAPFELEGPLVNYDRVAFMKPVKSMTNEEKKQFLSQHVDVGNISPSEWTIYMDKLSNLKEWFRVIQYLDIEFLSKRLVTITGLRLMGIRGQDQFKEIFGISQELDLSEFITKDESKTNNNEEESKTNNNDN